MFEKKRGKRFLASVMALVMLLSLAPVGALAADEPPTNEECSAGPLPAEEGSTPAVVDTPKEDTPTPQPAVAPKPVVADPVESNSEAVILPEGGLLDPAFGVNHDTSNSNDIAEHKDGNKSDRELVTTDSTTKYVIRFYVSNTGTKDSYTEQNKYGIPGQPNSTIDGAEGGDTVTIMVSPDYAILTQYTDVAKGISTEKFTAVNVTGDTDVRAWLNQYAENKVPDGLKNRDNVNAIVNFVNDQYNNSGKRLPTLDANKFNGFRFVDAHYVNSGECSIHVHVQLIKENQYIVHYDSNGGSGAMVDENLYFPGDQATVKANEFTRTGYTFAGWNTEEDGTGTSYNPNGDNNEVTIGTENVTLYAQWTPQTYQINYELYSGTNAKINPIGYTYGEGVSSFAPATKDNYNFEGWYSEPEFRNKVESISTTDTGDKTLYAHWIEEPTARPTTTDVYVYFKMVDAAGKNIPKTKINNEELKTTAYNKDVDGATWATLGKIASAETLTDGTEYKGTNTTLATVGNDAKNQLKNDDARHTDNKKIANTVLANIEWFQLRQWAGATGYVSDGSRWHLDGKITGYTVTYNNGTTEATADDVHNMPVDKMYYLRGSEYTVSDATPTREGYVFTGWKSDNDNKVYDSESKMIMPAKNVVLTAQWEEIYTVTFNAGDNGTLDGDLTQTGVSGTTLTEPAKAANTGYEFAGWVEGNDTTANKVEIPATITKNVTYTATWRIKQNPTPDTVNYTINKHFKNNKGTTIKDVSGTPTPGTRNATLSSLITSHEVDQPYGENKYVYVSGETTFTMNGQKVGSNTPLTSEATIDLYYYLDKWKDADEAGNDSETGGDGIPDCDQVLIKYVSSNSDRGTVSPDMEVLTLRKDNENVKIKINGSKATDKGGRNYFSNWTDEVNKQTINDATLTAKTIKKAIETAKGGETYTFTANFGYSGGGSGGSNRPKPPVVEIPDDVPTGLNGKDHYAYIIGYGNNDVRPQNNITRAEVATIFFRLLTDETREANMTKSNGYNDVKDGDWFCCAVSTLSKMGIIKGYEDGSFKPNDPISRAEFAAIAARFDPDGDKTPASFADVTSHWAKDEISIAANHGWIKGYEDGSFKPDQKITRAETMTLVNRVLNRLPEAKDDLHKDMKTWVDNMDETAWYYLAVQEATNSHYFKNKTGTKFEQWTDLRDTRDWSELEK